jgi:uncharacterized protein (DUF305 family)
MLLASALLLAACQPVGSQVAAPSAGAAESAAEATAAAEEAPATEAATEAAAEAATEAAAEATMDHSTMDHAAMGHEAMGDEPFDALFIDGMIVHHEGAITMAEQVLAESERPELRQMAEAIIAAQQGEVEQMHAWRAEWYPDLGETAGMDMDMGMMEIAEDDAKPFDQRFLEAMIDHHEGAIDMAEAALAASEHEEVRSMADAIISTQQAEIDQMRAWLSEWFGVQ